MYTGPLRFCALLGAEQPSARGNHTPSVGRRAWTRGSRVPGRSHVTCQRIRPSHLPYVNYERGSFYSINLKAYLSKVLMEDRFLLNRF